MNKLLSAGFSRMFKGKIFWIGIAFLVFIAIMINVTHYYDMLDGYNTYLDCDFFMVLVIIGIVAAVFCSLFICTDYSDGTIRNKITIGRSRIEIYLSKLIVSVTACILMYISYILVYTAIGALFLKMSETSFKTLLILFIAAIMLTAAYCSIFTLLSMLIGNKAISSVVCILFSLVLFCGGVYLSSKLEEPEYLYFTASADDYGITYDDDEISETSETAKKTVPNPHYVSGTEREIYEFLYDFLPCGQAIQISNNDYKRPELFIPYSSVIIVVTTAVGIFFFRKKNIK